MRILISVWNISYFLSFWQNVGADFFVWIILFIPRYAHISMWLPKKLTHSAFLSSRDTKQQCTNDNLPKECHLNFPNCNGKKLKTFIFSKYNLFFVPNKVKLLCCCYINLCGANKTIRYVIIPYKRGKNLYLPTIAPLIEKLIVWTI